MFKKLLAKLTGAEWPPQGESSADKFQREQRTASENAREEEARRKANIQEDQWQEVKLPEGTEQNPE